MNKEIVLKYFVNVVFLVSFLAGNSSAMIIRHDVDDQHYLELGEKYSSSVAYINGCVGTLIDPGWILTAAHCVADEAHLITVNHTGNVYRVETTVVHPEWDSNNVSSYDIALIQLAEPIDNGNPAKLYSSTDEKGKPVVFVGRGDFGNGRDGPVVQDGKQRGATNTIISVSEQLIGFRFDQPESATDLEGISGPGDSGGPAFIAMDSKLYVAGVSSHQNHDGKEGVYGVQEFYTRVSTHAAWIQSVIDNAQPAAIPASHPIINAIKNNNQAQFDEALSPDVLANDDVMNEAFYQSAVLNRISFAEQLVSRGANIKSIDIQGMSLFEFALKLKQFDYFDSLLNTTRQDEKPKFENSRVVPLLIEANGADSRVIDRLERLLDQGASIDARIHDGVTALMLAVSRTNNIELVRFLVEQGADLNAQHDGGASPLMASAHLGKVEILEYLLEKGARINLNTRQGNTALDIARANGNDEAIRLLESKVPAGAVREFDVDKMNRFFDAIESNDRGMFSLSIFDNGNQVFQRSIGFENIENQVKATSATRYRIGSISKSLMAAIIMQMVEEGELQLQTTLSEYYPAFQYADNITIEHLLRHRSGLFNFTDDPAYTSYMELPQTQEELLARMMANENTFVPDAKMEYSNTGYVLLSFIAEKVDEKTFDEILQERIAEPHGLQDTYVGGKIGVKENEAQSYILSADGWAQASETDMSIPAGAGAIVSTPGDINRFYHALFAGKIVTPSSVDLMTSMKDNYGFGVTQFPFYRKTAIGHDGSIDGFNSIAGQFVAEGATLSLVSNAADFQLNGIAIGVLSIYFGADYEIPDLKLVDVAEKLSAQYVGVYESSTHPLDIEIAKSLNTLTAQATGQGSFPIRAMGDHLFTFDPAGITMTFDIEAGTMAFTQGGDQHIFEKN